MPTFNQLVRKGRQVLATKSTAPALLKTYNSQVSLPEGGDYPLPGGRTLHIRVVSACFEEKTQGVHKKDLKNQADYAKINSICPVLRLRCRQPGDRFRPAGRGVDGSVTT